MAILQRIYTKEKYEATYYVEESEHGMRLDQFVQIYLDTWSRQEVKRRIAAGDVIIKNRPGKHKPSTLLHYQEEVTFTVHNTTQEDEYWNGKLIERDENPPIIYEDENLLVISKPAYMAAHPTGKHLFNCATVHFGQVYGKTIHTIHRLDRETSGVMMLGKNPDTANLMGEEFYLDRVRKCYFFMARENENYDGKVYFESKERLGANEGGLRKIYINHHPENSKEGKRAHTKFKVFYRENGYALGLAFPQTGRQHQIRVHAMVRGLPLVGDKLYLGSFKMFQRFKDNIAKPEDHEHMEHHRHALHAVALRIKYENEFRIFRSGLPTDFLPLIKERVSISIEEVEKMMLDGILEYFDNAPLEK